jgi:hypothetical protein
VGQRLEAPNGDLVIFDTDPNELIRKIIALLDEHNKDIDTKALQEEWYLEDRTDNRNG